MKIAVPTREGRVDDHFGHCAYYIIFDVVNGKVTGTSKLGSRSEELVASYLAGEIKDNGEICGHHDCH